MDTNIKTAKDATTLYNESKKEFNRINLHIRIMSVIGTLLCLILGVWILATTLAETMLSLGIAMLIVSMLFAVSGYYSTQTPFEKTRLAKELSARIQNDN